MLGSFAIRSMCLYAIDASSAAVLFYMALVAGFLFGLFIFSLFALLCCSVRTTRFRQGDAEEYARVKSFVVKQTEGIGKKKKNR